MAVARVTNLRTGTVLGSRIRIAESFGERLQGLIGTRALQEQQGLYLSRCRSIHTFFMSIPIDVVFLDADDIVAGIRPRLAPFRLAFGPWRGAGVLEMKSGCLEKRDIAVGDKLGFHREEG